MSDLYTHIRDNLVLPVLTKYGRAMVVRRTVAGVYDPETKRTAAPVVTDYPCKGMIHSVDRITASQLIAISTEQNTLAESVKSAMYISASGYDFVPGLGGSRVTDELVVGSDKYNLNKCIPVSPAGIPVMYILLVDK